MSKIKIEDKKCRKDESERMVRKRVREWEYGGKKKEKNVKDRGEELVKSRRSRKGERTKYDQRQEIPSAMETR